METKNTKTRINAGLILHTFLEDFSEIKRHIEEAFPETKIIYQKACSPDEKLFIKKDEEERNERGK